MTSLANLFGVDPADPETLRAIALAESDRQFLRALVHLRHELGLTQQDVADRLQVKQATIAAFERHDNDPKLSTIRRYAQVVGLLIDHDVQIDRSQKTGFSGETTGTWTFVGKARGPAPIQTVSLENQTSIPVAEVHATQLDFAVAA